MAFFFATAIASAQNDVFIVAGFRSAAILTLPLLKHIYIYIYMAAVLCLTAVGCHKSLYAAIDPMYNDGHKKHCNRRHIAVVFAPAAKKPLQ